MDIIFKHLLIYFFAVLIINTTNAQTNYPGVSTQGISKQTSEHSNLDYRVKKAVVESPVTIGFSYGIGNQAVFPFKNSNYHYKNRFYKLHYRYKLTHKPTWNFEAVIEPTYYQSKHRLLNPYYIKPEDSSTYLLDRETYSKERIINEYVLQLGLLWRYNITPKFSFYTTVSSGPMLLDNESERQAKGFSFSSLGGLGLVYQINKLFIEFRVSARHVSNLEFIQPNDGYNSVTAEFGVFTKL